MGSALFYIVDGLVNDGAVEAYASLECPRQWANETPDHADELMLNGTENAWCSLHPCAHA